MAKEVNKKINIWLNQQGIDNNLKSIRSEINKTANELNKLPIGTEEWYRKSEKLKKLKEIYKEVKGSVDDTKKSFQDMVITAGGLTATVHGASAAIQRFVASTQEYVDAYARMDDAMTNVSKYTGLTREEVKQLNEEFRKMDTRTPTEKLNALAADAGRLGITSKEAIKDFVEAADIINVALGEDLGEDAVKEIGKLAEMFGTTNTMGLRGAMLATGSAINTLAQSSSASERYLMDFTSRLSGAANQAKMTQAEVLGFASVLDQNKQQVEMSATAMQKLMMDMFTEPAKYAKLAGMSVKDFSDLLKNDANEALLTFFETLNRKGGLSDLAPIFDKLGLDGARASGVISVLAQNIDDVREEQELANTAFQEGTSVINEAAAVNGNAAAQLEKAKKAVEDAKAALGEELLPVITELTKGTASGIKVIAEIVKWGTQHTGIIKALAAAYTALLIAKNRKLIVDKVEATQTKINNTLRQISINSHVKKKVALTAERAATEAKTLASMQARLETLKGVAADNQMRAVLVQETVAKQANAAATKAQAQAQRLLNTATKSTPWGLIAAGITAATVVITHYIEKARETKKATEELNHAINEEKSHAEYLVDVLKNTEKGSDEYNAALQRLKELYPDIIQAHIDEKGELTGLIQLNEDLADAIDKRIRHEKREEAITDASTKKLDAQKDAIQGIIDAMTAQGVSAEKQKTALAEIRKTIDNFKDDEIFEENGYKFAARLNDSAIASLEKELKKMGIDVLSTKGNRWSGMSISAFLNSAKGEYEQYRADLQKIDEIYGTLEEVSSTESQHTGDPKTCMCADCKKKREEDAATLQEERKETVKKQEAFRKKMTELEHKDSVAALNDWERIKAEIHKKHQDLIDESEQLFGKNNKYIQQIQGMEAQALSAAADKYLQKTKDFAANFATEIDKMLADTQGDTGEPQSRLVTAIAGSDKEWEKAIAKAEENAKALEKILSDIDENDPLWNDFATQLAAVQDQIDAAQLKQVEARAAITKKFVEEEMKGLKQREKEQQRQIALNKQGITEEQIAALQRQWKIDDLREEYDVEIKLMEAALKAAEANKDTEGIKNIEKMIETLKELRNNVEATVDAGTNGTKKTGNALIDLMTGALTNPQERFRAVLDVMQDFANRAADIYRQIADAQQQSAELDMERFNDAQDAKARKLRQQLDDGLISQKYYDAQMEKMEAEKEQREKKMKHEQFERERKSAIVQALIQGGLAVARGFAEWGWPGGLIAGALTTAETAAQVALIASQVNPYAKGGYIRKKQLALVGEEGQEWVASNSLLEDEETAPVIAALEEYQRGNRNALRLVAPTQPAWKNLSQSASQISSTFASNRTPVEHHYYQSAGTDELLKEVKQMNQFLADPQNRQAYISYKIQTEAQKNRDFIKQAARL